MTNSIPIEPDIEDEIATRLNLEDWLERLYRICSEREIETLILKVEGLSDAEIANRLNRSKQTISNRLCKIRQKARGLGRP